MVKSQISTYSFNESLQDVFIAYENIIAYSPVFLCMNDGVFKVYVNQTGELDNGTAWLIGVAQNDAGVGEEVKVINKGLTNIRVYSRTNVNNRNVFLMAYNGNSLSNGCTCLHSEEGIPVYDADNSKSNLFVGHIIVSNETTPSPTNEPVNDPLL